ncbi:MAG: hypothetical protein ACYC6L_03025 [Anaerolineae bacterium]
MQRQTWSTMPYKLYTLAERPELGAEIEALSRASWPAFLLHGNTGHWQLLFERFAAYQLLLCESDGSLVAVGHSVPLVWDGSLADLPHTIDAILRRGARALRRGETANTLSATAVMVRAESQGQHLSSLMVEAMRTLAREHACTSLIAPVRPTWKWRYPLTPMQHYITWQPDDGAPYDPWIRVHWRLGAQVLAVAPNTLTVQSRVGEWESWTGMSYPESGRYIVPGALQPVRIDRVRDAGIYRDPNVWMKHAVSG